MRKNQFLFRMIALAVCAAVSIGFFYAPYEENNVSAYEEELRGVWVSTVANIDYPTTQTTDPSVLKKEMTTLLDLCKTMGFNAVFLQVRPLRRCSLCIRNLSLVSVFDRGAGACTSKWI